MRDPLTLGRQQLRDLAPESTTSLTYPQRCPFSAHLSIGSLQAAITSLTYVTQRLLHFGCVLPQSDGTRLRRAAIPLQSEKPKTF